MPDQGELSALLNKWETERAQLDILISRLRAEMGLEPASNSPSPSIVGPTVGQPIVTGRIRSDEFFRMSIPEAVRRYLEIMKQPQPPTAIVTALKSGGVLSQSKNFYTTVFTAIKRLKASGELVNTKTGWALADWYAGRSGAAVEPKRKKRKGGKKRPIGGQKSKPLLLTPGPKDNLKIEVPGSYTAFVAEQRKAGKSMQEIGAAWRAKKGA